VLLTKKFVRKLIPKRCPDTHKGNFGHVLILAGSRGMTGAAVLCANSALRCGAGLVTLGIPESQANIVASRVLPEVMTLPLKGTSQGTLSLSGFSKLKEHITSRKITALAVGPGLSTNPETKKLVKKILTDMDLPVVLDADGINALEKDWILKKHKAKIIITPHPGELGRLTKFSAGDIQKNREKFTRKFARDNKLLCVLKGHRTVITDGKKSYINTTGNPGMATGGSGDVLAGMIASLTNQVRSRNSKALLDSAIAGVYLHGLAGDMAAKEKTEIGMIAGDIIEKIPGAIKSVTK
jgi:NAD(P)H-hydrate epimerase